jgi:osmotically-inducible protein OsmY
VTAENIKIITINGRVTLRGPVKSSAEKSAIVAKAQQIAGTTQVDDQLEVADSHTGG